MSNNCEVVYNYTTPEFALPCDGSRRTVYENLTGRLVNATLELNAYSSSTPCTVTMIIRRTEGGTITRSVTVSEVNTQGRSVTVNGVKSVCVECSGGLPTDTCSGYVAIDLQYCRCCG